MERIGIIDLGSNSVRLVIVEVDDHGAYYQRGESERDSSTNCRYRREWYSVRKSNALCNRNDHQLFVRLCKARALTTLLRWPTAAARRAANRASLSTASKRDQS